MLVDLVMWTKNGAETLPSVLKRISEVIPDESVNNRILVDDNSTDGTCEIAESFGWQIILNKGCGISDGANTALQHVESDWFVSFEQDLLLSRNWWNRLSMYVGGVFPVISGLRVANSPDGLAKLQRYVAEKYLSKKLSGWLRSRGENTFFLGKTLDNTIYRADFLRGIGGFPLPGESFGVDTALARKIGGAGRTWLVCSDVVSLHLRGGLRDELRHQASHGKACARTRTAVFGWAVSPFVGVFLSVKTGDPVVCLYYFLLKLAYLRGNLSK
jgi:glycosyltransferase involved in cell wall biosynthesis